MLSTALVSAQIAFYIVGALTLLVGAGLGVRRFVFERPYQQSWEVEISPGQIRRVGSPREEYFHDVRLRFRNRSLAYQMVEGCWINLYRPDQDNFDGQLFKRADWTVSGMSAFFGDRGVAPAVQYLSHGDEAFFGMTLGTERLHPVLRVCCAVQTRRRRLFWPGFHDESTIVGIMNQFVFMEVGDIQHYEDPPERVPSA